MPHPSYFSRFSFAFLLLAAIATSPSWGFEDLKPKENTPPSVWLIAVNLNANDRGHGKEESVAKWFTDKKGANWDRSHVLSIDKSTESQMKHTAKSIEERINTWLNTLKLGNDDIFLLSMRGTFRLGNGENRSQAGLISDDGEVFRIDLLHDRLRALGGNQRHHVLSWIDGTLDENHPVLGKSGQPISSSDDYRNFALRLTPGKLYTSWVSLRPQEEVAKKGRSLTRNLLKSLEEQPWNLHHALEQLQQNQKQEKLNFLAVGGLPIGLNLIKGETRLARDSDRQVVIQSRHTQGIESLLVSPDGERMFTTAGRDKTIRVWDLGEKAISRIIGDHPRDITQIALCNNAETLVSGDKAGTIRFIDHADTTKPYLVFDKVHKTSIQSLVRLSDDDHLVSVDRNFQASLWSIHPAVTPSRIEESLKCVVSARKPGTVHFVGMDTAGSIILYGTTVKPLGRFGKFPNKSPLALAPIGDFLAVASAKKLEVFDISRPDNAKRISHAEFEEVVNAIAFDQEKGETIAVGLSSEIKCVRRDDGSPLDLNGSLDVSSPPRQIEFRGNLLATIIDRQALRWIISNGDTKFPPKKFPVARDPFNITYPRSMFLGDTVMAIGMTDGKSHVWKSPGRDYPDKIEIPELPGTGRDRLLSVSETGNHLLDIQEDHRAFLIDFGVDDQVVAKSINGDWLHGQIDPRGERIALIPSEPRNEAWLLQSGDVSGRVRLVPKLDEPAGNGAAKLERVAFSRDGKRVAALGPGLQVWIWETEKHVRQARGLPSRNHSASALGLEFSSDGTRLMTFSDEEIVLRSTDKSGDDLNLIRASEMKDFGRITAARLHPSDDLLVFAGSLKGKLAVLRNLKKGPQSPVLIDCAGIEGTLLDLNFSKDGKLLAAAGEDRILHLWGLNSDGGFTPIRPPTTQNHADTIHAVIPWTPPRNQEQERAGKGNSRRVFITASDDSTLRFWNADADRDGPESNPLMAILSLLIPDRPKSAPAPGAKPQSESPVNFAFFSPEGSFDDSTPPEAIRVRIFNRLFSKELITRSEKPFLSYFREGEIIPKLSLDLPDDLAIAPEKIEPNGEGEARLEVKYRPGLSRRIWLYQNGQPREITSPKKEGKATISVRLAKGRNVFFAMSESGRAKGILARSNEYEYKYIDESKPVANKLHVLALGVSKYQGGHSLHFATADARELATHLVQNRQEEERGKFITLLDDKVNRESVEKAFDEIQAAMKNSPNDAIIVSLAGHADVLDGKFQLLLTDFPFDGPKPGGDAPDSMTLPFSLIADRMAKLDCLKRLVVIDACKAGAAADPASLRQLGRIVGTTQPITSFILAAHGNETAAESDSLKHGFLTYVLLRGLSAGNLESLNEVEAKFQTARNADSDHDKIVTNIELADYVEKMLPLLTSAYVSDALRGQKEEPGPELFKSPNLARSDGNDGIRPFPVMRLPDPTPRGEGTQP